MIIDDLEEFVDETDSFINYHRDEIHSKILEGLIVVNNAPDSDDALIESLPEDMIERLGELFVAQKYQEYLQAVFNLTGYKGAKETMFVRFLYDRFFYEVDPYEVGHYIASQL